MASNLPQGYTLDPPAIPQGYTLDQPSPPGTGDIGAQDTTVEAILPKGAPEWLKSILKGATQGVKELGHGLTERVGGGAAVIASDLTGSDIPIQGAEDFTKSAQAQEAAYNAVHPDSIMNSPQEKLQSKARDISKIIPYFFAGPEAKLADTIGVNAAAGAAQPLNPGENPITSPLTSGVTGGLGYGVSKILNFGLNKAANSSALKTMFENLGADKATVSDKGIYGAITDLASKADTFKPGTPEFIRGQQAKQFVSMINSKLQSAQQGNSPEWQLALRSDAGARMLGNKLISDTLFQSRDDIAQEISKKYGPIDTKGLTSELSALVNKPDNKIKLGGVTQPINQANTVLKQGQNTLPGISTYVMQNNPALAEALNAVNSQVDYKTLASIRSAIDSKASELASKQDTAAPIYAQASQTIDNFMDNYAKDKGDLGAMLQKTDSEARDFYRKNVIPYNEKNLGRDITDPLKNSESISKPFGNFEEDSPEQAMRLKNLLTPEGQSAVRKGMVQTALSAATDDNGYIDAAVFKKGMDMTPNTRNIFFKDPQDKATIDGINNLIAINARTFGKSNNYYQKYMQAYGLENTMAGEFVKGAKQMTAPIFYNLLNKAVFESPTIKRFVQASGNISEDSPKGLAMANKFSKMINQYIAAQLATSQQVQAPVNQVLGAQ